MDECFVDICQPWFMLGLYSSAFSLWLAATAKQEANSSLFSTASSAPKEDCQILGLKTPTTPTTTPPATVVMLMFIAKQQAQPAAGGGRSLAGRSLCLFCNLLLSPALFGCCCLATKSEGSAINKGRKPSCKAGAFERKRGKVRRRRRRLLLLTTTQKAATSVKKKANGTTKNKGKAAFQRPLNVLLLPAVAKEEIESRDQKLESFFCNNLYLGQTCNIVLICHKGVQLDFALRRQARECFIFKQQLLLLCSPV